ncbi:30S ribosomal protein [Tanacetum coccineum]
MASQLLHFRPKHRHILRHFSSSNNNNNKSRPSFFTDLKSSLKQPQQSQPPHRPSFFNSNPNPNSQKVASLEEIRKNLSEFRSRSAVTPPPPPSSSQSPPISFQEMYQRNVMPKPDSGSEPVSLNAIRSSLKNMKSGSTPRLQLSEISESLNLRPRSAGSAKSVVSDETKTDFVKMYSYVELGGKLRGLRTVNDKKSSRKEKTFSLAELNERLKKLREIDEKEVNARGINYTQLRESLIKMSDDNKTKQSAAQRISVFAQLGGTPSFMLSPPKEELVEKYFHPDHMSSAEKQKLELKNVRDKFKISESDCGSSRVQVRQNVY